MITSALNSAWSPPPGHLPSRAGLSRLRWAPPKETASYSCAFLYICSGYYDYENGYAPDFTGEDTFRGLIVHPQHWPKDLNYAGKRVVIIGSGATAVTLVPAMAGKAAHVTMLPALAKLHRRASAKDAIAALFSKVLPRRMAHRATRAKVILVTMFFYQLSRRFPGLVKNLIRRDQRKRLPADYDIDTPLQAALQPVGSARMRGA